MKDPLYCRLPHLPSSYLLRPLNPTGPSALELKSWDLGFKGYLNPEEPTFSRTYIRKS